MSTFSSASARLVRAAALSLLMGAAPNACSSSSGQAVSLQPTVKIASAPQTPYLLTTDGTHVFWTSPVTGPAAVAQVAADGSGSVTVLSGGDANAQGIATDGRFVYWANSTAAIGSVDQVPDGGGGVVAVVAAQPSMNGAPTAKAVLQGLNPKALATDGTWVYWANSGADGTTPAVMKIRVDGTGLATIAGAGEPDEVAIDSTSVYWTDSAKGTVMRADLAGTPSSMVTLAAGQNHPHAIAVDASSVYWTNAGNPCPLGQSGCSSNGTSAVMKVALRGGTPATLASGLDYAGELAIDAHDVYFTTLNAAKIMRVGLGGGSPTVIAQASGGYTAGIATDGKGSVYWTDPLAAGIMKTTPSS